jgi:hypothetical protein
MRDRAHFLRAGISGASDLTAKPPFYNIEDLMQVNGHEYVDILKMDIEGSVFSKLLLLSPLTGENHGNAIWNAMTDRM